MKVGEQIDISDRGIQEAARRDFIASFQGKMESKISDILSPDLVSLKRVGSDDVTIECGLDEFDAAFGIDPNGLFLKDHHFFHDRKILIHNTAVQNRTDLSFATL